MLPNQVPQFGQGPAVAPAPQAPAPVGPPAAAPSQESPMTSELIKLLMGQNGGQKQNPMAQTNQVPQLTQATSGLGAMANVVQGYQQGLANQQQNANQQVADQNAWMPVVTPAAG